MKTKYSNLLLISVSLILASCNDYLDQLPDNRIEIDSPEGVEELLVEAYPRASYVHFCEVMSDNAGDRGTGAIYQNPVNTESYFWKEFYSTEGQGTPTFYWKACYKAIAHANLALETISDFGDSKEYASYKGEALVARAYAYFMLVNLFSEHYDSNSAASDLGIPLVTEVEKTVQKKYKRSTVQEVYDFIEKDLLEGMKMLDDDRYFVPKYHFTKQAASAFAVRYYLFRALKKRINDKDDFDRVIEFADEVLGSKPADKLRDLNGFYKTASYQEKEAQYTKSTEKANLLLCEAVSNWGYYYKFYRYGMAQNYIDDVLRSNRVNNGVWSYKLNVHGMQTTYHTPKWRAHKIQGSSNAASFTPSDIIPLFSIDEIFLSRVEALVLKGKFNDAIDQLNILLSKKIDYYNSNVHKLDMAMLKTMYKQTDEQKALLAFVLEMRQREFAQEGLRWFDVRRYKIPVVHKTMEGQTLKLSADDARKVLQIPEDAIAEGLIPNQR